MKKNQNEKKIDDEIKPEPPALIKQIKWVQLYGFKNWKLVIIALIFISIYPAYQIIWPHFNSPKELSPLGSFQIHFVNQTSEQVSVSNNGEFYLQAPEVPGKNRDVSGGVIQLQFAPNQYTLYIAPYKTITLSAILINEKRFLEYLDAGDNFSRIIFSASPKPTSTEVLFSRKTFEAPIEIQVGIKQ